MDTRTNSPNRHSLKDTPEAEESMTGIYSLLLALFVLLPLVAGLLA